MKINQLILVFLFFATSVNADTGDRLAYLQYDGDYWQVYINDENGNVRKVTSSQYDKSTISWFSNGSKLFVCGIQAEAEVVEIKTGAVEKINLPKSPVNDAVISSDGNRILYSYIAADATNNKLWLYDRRTDKNSEILKNVQGRQYDPKWSMDSDTFYFTTGIANKNYSIAKATSGFNMVEIIIQNTNLNLDADPGVNGNIVYSSNIKNSFNIWMLKNKKVMQITNSPDADTHPSWSKKTGVIYFARVRNGISNIWRLAMESESAARQFTNSEIGARYPVVFKGEKH